MRQKKEDRLKIVSSLAQVAENYTEANAKIQ